MKKFVLVLILFTSFVAIPATAQAPECAPSNLIAEIAALKATGDNATDIEALLELRDQITAQNIACNGYVFEGSGGKAVGPIELPEGVFLLTFTTGGYIILNARLLDGSCSEDGDEFDGSSILAESRGGAEQGAPVIIDSEGCKILFTLENISSSWTLTIEPLS